MSIVDSLFAAEASLRSAAIVYSDCESSMAVEDRARAKRDASRDLLRRAALLYAAAANAIPAIAALTAERDSLRAHVEAQDARIKGLEATIAGKVSP